MIFLPLCALVEAVAHIRTFELSAIFSEDECNRFHNNAGSLQTRVNLVALTNQKGSGGKDPALLWNLFGSKPTFPMANRKAAQSQAGYSEIFETNFARFSL